jgi:hypothetical protein
MKVNKLSPFVTHAAGGSIRKCECGPRSRRFRSRGIFVCKEEEGENGEDCIVWSFVILLFTY